MFVPAPINGPQVKKKTHQRSHHQTATPASQFPAQPPSVADPSSVHLRSASTPVLYQPPQGSVSPQRQASQQQQQGGSETDGTPLLMADTSTASMPPFIVDANLMLANRGQPTRRARQLLRPLFHVTASDTTIVALECLPQRGIVGFALSNGEVYVATMPTAAAGVGTGAGGDGAYASQPVGPNGEGMLDACTQVQLIGKVPGGCSQLVWAPRSGAYRDATRMYLAGCCPGRCVKLFSCYVATGEWCEERVDVQDIIAVAFAASPFGGQHVSLVCACAKQRIVVCQRRDEGFGSWADTSAFHVAAVNEQSCDASLATSTTSVTTGRTTKRNASSREFLCVAVSDSGSLVAVGDQEGTLRCFELGMASKQPSMSPVFTTTAAGGIGAGAAANNKVSPAGSSNAPLGIRHVAWAVANGRSFTPLAYASPTELCVVLFANATHYMLENNQPSSQSQLTTLGMRRIDVLDADILKVSWNAYGTRLTTSHADGTARIYSVTITLRDVRNRGSSIAPNPNNNGNPTVLPPTTTMVDKYIVDLVEIGRSTAPFAADSLPNCRST